MLKGKKIKVSDREKTMKGEKAERKEDEGRVRKNDKGWGNGGEGEREG